LRDDGRMAESQLLELRNMWVLLEEARVLARGLAYHRRTAFEATLERSRRWTFRSMTCAEGGAGDRVGTSRFSAASPVLCGLVTCAPPAAGPAVAPNDGVATEGRPA
jgi:hypothetical protein